MAEENPLRLAVIHDTLPTEIFVKILKLLDFNNILLARRTCKDWKRIIDVFKLVKEAARKYSKKALKTIFRNTKIPIFFKSMLHMKTT